MTVVGVVALNMSISELPRKMFSVKAVWFTTNRTGCFTANENFRSVVHGGGKR